MPPAPRRARRPPPLISGPPSQNHVQKRPQNWTAEEKWALVTEAATVAEADLGAFLRRKGLHRAQLAEWRAAAMAGLQRPRQRERKEATRERLQIRQLKREIKQKNEALAEAAALLALKKKPRRWGKKNDDTTPPSDG